MRRNSVAFAIGLNMAEVERRRSYAITQVTCDTGDVLPARGGQRGALRNDAAHMSASLGGTRNDGLGPRRHWEHIHRRMIWLLAGVLRASFRGRSARKGMGIRSHFQFRRTGSECALAIQPVTALLAELFPREVVIKEYRRTAGAPIAILYGSCLGFGQLTRQSVHVKYPPVFTSNISRLIVRIMRR